MASGTLQIPKSGWSDREDFDTKEYGVLIGYINPILGIAIIKWVGNSVSSPSGEISITIPNKYCPKNNFSTVMRNGDQLEVRVDGSVKLTFTSSATWTGCSIMYPLI